MSDYKNTSLQPQSGARMAWDEMDNPAPSSFAAPRLLAALSRKWRDQANTLARRANELSGHRRDKDAADMRARASVYFICADDLDKQQAANAEVSDRSAK